MRICENGIYRDMTEDEISQIQSEQRKYEVYEKHRQLTEQEVNQLFIREQINTLSIDDSISLKMIDYYPTWEDLIGQQATKDFKFTYQGKLYKVIQGHTFSSAWIPNNGTESLYIRIDEEHDGDVYDPIPYEGNMVLVNGKYYTQDNVVYLCFRDTVNQVNNPLSELVEIYVKIVDITNL